MKTLPLKTRYTNLTLQATCQNPTCRAKFQTVRGTQLYPTAYACIGFICQHCGTDVSFTKSDFPDDELFDYIYLRKFEKK